MEWTPQKKGFVVGRMHYTPPGTGEFHYMRTLLNHVKGPTCYEDIRTVGDDVHATFRDACFARGLLQDDKEFINAINEASTWGSAHYLRMLFATLLLANELVTP